MQASLSHPSFTLLMLAFLFSCQTEPHQPNLADEQAYVVLLGTVQDAGSPQTACTQPCCADLFQHPDRRRKVVSLGLVDPVNGKRYLFEAGPDFREQLHDLNQLATDKTLPWPDGIFITHAHIGHYTGLLHLGKEAMHANGCKVFALPRMLTFLQNNAPWSQLCTTNNIALQSMKADSVLLLEGGLSVTALQVPHRDEFSETAAFLIQGPNRSLLFIPDIDKWEKWEKNIVNLIHAVDYALIDGTFYSAGELKNRNIAEIPHPLVEESMRLFKHLEPEQKNKIHFIHFNHSNPLLDSLSKEYSHVNKQGYHCARYHQKFGL